MSDYISFGGAYAPPSYNFTQIADNMKSPGLRNVGSSSKFNSMGLLSGIVGAVGNIFTTGMNNRAQAKEAEKNRQFNAQEAQKNRDWQEKMVGEERAYNDPSNQRKLMEAAGYNPNVLASGMAGSSVSSSASASGAQASSSSIPNFSPVGYGAMQDFANLKLTDSQADLNEAQAKKVSSETTGQDISNTMANFQSMLLEKYGEVEKTLGISAQRLSNNLTEIQTSVQSMTDKLMRFDLDNLSPKRVAALAAQIAKDNASAELASSQAAKTDREIHFMATEIGIKTGLYFAQLRNLEFQNKQLGASSLLLGKQADYVQSQTYGQRLANKFSAYDYNLRARHSDKFEKAFVGDLNRILSETDIFGDRQRGFVSFFRGLDFVLDSTIGNIPVTFLK